MPYSTNSITTNAVKGSTSVTCNATKLRLEDGIGRGSSVSIQPISVGADVALTGTVDSTGAALTGSGTSFTSELNEGAVVYDGSGEYRRVGAVIDDTTAGLEAAFTVDLSGSTLTVKTGADPKIVKDIFPEKGLIHFTKSIRLQGHDATDAHIVKLD